MKTGDMIKKAGLKATPQRKMVYEIMMGLRHSSMDEIFERVRRQNPEINISTIYRILDTFCISGLISKINHPDGKCFYDINPSAHHHVFLDNEVIDYIDPELTELI